MLRVMGLSTDNTFRKKVAVELGVVTRESEYDGNFLQNTAMLNELRLMVRLTRGVTPENLKKLV